MYYAQLQTESSEIVIFKSLNKQIKNNNKWCYGSKVIEFKSCVLSRTSILGGIMQWSIAWVKRQQLLFIDNRQYLLQFGRHIYILLGGGGETWIFLGGLRVLDKTLFTSCRLVKEMWQIKYYLIDCWCLLYAEQFNFYVICCSLCYFLIPVIEYSCFSLLACVQSSTFMLKSAVSSVSVYSSVYSMFMTCSKYTYMVKLEI